MVRGSAALPKRISWAAFLVDLPMQRVKEVPGLEEIGNAVERLVVDQDSAEQRLLDLDVVGALPVQRLIKWRQNVGEGHQISGTFRAGLTPRCVLRNRLSPRLGNRARYPRSERRSLDRAGLFTSHAK
jgi:hypothetical protein